MKWRDALWVLSIFDTWVWCAQCVHGCSMQQVDMDCSGSLVCAEIVHAIDHNKYTLEQRDTCLISTFY